MNFRYLSGRRGVTLLEAVVATFIMALGLFVVGTAIYSQFSSLNQNREKAIATLAAQGEIEFLRGQPFGGIVTKPFYKEDAPGLGYLRYGSGFGKGDIVVDSAGFTANSNIKRVSVTVKWDSISGKSLEKTVTTLMTNSGINKQ